MGKVVVIGSLNMDLVTTCSRAPEGGETLFGDKFLQIPGGKGANQAVAIGKLSTNITMLGKVGNDSFGEELLLSLKNNGVDVNSIERSGIPTGIANIMVEKNGQNRILVVAGANGDVDKHYIDRHLDKIKECDMVVLQLEIPKETVAYALKKAKEFNKFTILNPAPATDLSEDIIKNSDLIIPNETELAFITGIDTTNMEGIKKAGEKLLNMGVKDLIITLGGKGSLHMNKDKFQFHSAYKVNVVDTTAAGDSFIGGLVKNLMTKTIDDSIEFATKVSAIAVTKMGAQSSIPTLDEVLAFKGDKKGDKNEKE